ncbi:UNVERIFIED_ORG: Fe-S-cluster-containing hydrogenase component 2 [Pseudomonas vranovensis]|nr:Fe-S-cluster-containing hydrogenase component 2 [Pseudomonas vranovensis]
MASQDIIARSATTTAPSSIRQQEEVAKLIDTTKCIGCKACQVACSEWNELRDEVGHNHGTYDNPQDLSAETWTLMRFTEHETDEGNLEWLIRKDGCMHCAEPGCLKACPSPGAIIKHANGIVDFNQDHCIGCGYCITGCPFNIRADLAEGPQGLQVHPVFRPGVGGAGAGLRENLPDRRHCLWQQAGHEGACRRAHRRPQVAWLRQRWFV